MFTTQFLLSVLGAAAAGHIAGMLWFSPVLFLNPWKKALGKTDADMASNKKEMPRIALYGFLNTFAMAFALGGITELLTPTSLLQYLQIAFFICFSFVITTKFNDLIYTSKEPHWSRQPQILFLINVGYYVLSFTAMALVFWLLIPFPIKVFV